MEQRLVQLVEVLEGGRPEVCDIMDMVLEIDKDMLELGDSVVNAPLLARFRRLRFLSNLPILEKSYWLDINGQTILASVATNLFVLEMSLSYNCHVADWNREMEETGRLVSFTDVLPEERLKFLKTEPESEMFRMPVSQLMGNLRILTDGATRHFTVPELTDLVEALYNRAVVLAALHLPSEDHDMEDYRIRAQHDSTVFRTNYQFMAELRLYFDTLFKQIHESDRLNVQEASLPSLPSLTVEVLKAAVHEKCGSFEREHFLEEFTEYVLNQKIMTPLLDKLYRQKFPDVSKPDARRIVKHFYGQGAVVDHSGFRHIADLFEENVEFSSEFAILFYLRMVHSHQPDQLVRHPLHPLRWSFHEIETDKLVPFTCFVGAMCYYMSTPKMKTVLETLLETCTNL